MPKQRKLVRIKDIAKEAKVSMSSVSLALNDPSLLNPQTRSHILRIVKESGYSRVKKVKHRGYIGVITDDFNNMICGEFYNVVVLGILNELRKKQANVLIDATMHDTEYFPKMITKNMADGILFLGTSSRDLVYIAKQKRIPIVLVGHPLPELELHCVVPDGRAGGFQAAKHLIDLGHKKIAIITGKPEYDPVSTERLEGYRFALAQNGIEERKDYVIEADFCHPQTAYDAAKRLLELNDPPTAIFCVSDSLAYRTYPAILEKGLKIPDDISVVGFDNIQSPGFASMPEPALTSIHINRMEMGRISVELLYDLIQDPSKHVYKYSMNVSLSVKSSTASPKK